MPVRTVAVVVNTEKPLAVEAGQAITEWLENHGIRPMFPPEGADKVGRPDLAVEGDLPWSKAELLIVLGGDGTLLRAAKRVAPMLVPVLGINTGHLGFLTEIENGEVFDHLAQFLAGEYLIEERMMLTATVERAGSVVAEVTALNDAVISKGPRARLVHLHVAVAGTYVARYPADGVIVATPTGSTAYSLSAGGPVVGPTVDVLLITPVCPHTMNSRSIVVAGEEEVTVTVEETGGEVGLSADGSDMLLLEPGDRIRVRRSPFKALLVRRESYRFYDVLRQKLASPGR